MIVNVNARIGNQSSIHIPTLTNTKNVTKNKLHIQMTNKKKA